MIPPLHPGFSVIRLSLSPAVCQLLQVPPVSGSDFSHVRIIQIGIGALDAEPPLMDMTMAAAALRRYQHKEHITR